jgi:hypothetical protein
VPSNRRSSKRPWGGEHPELDLERARSGGWSEQGADGEWSVRSVTGTKAYRCPGCQQEIGIGTVHVVAWRQDSLLGAETAVSDRRHWHGGCWRTRGRRR